MLAVLAAGINLMPDWTIIVQLGVFLSTLTVLNFLVFRPVLRIIDRRRSFTSDARADAERLGAEAAKLEGERAGALAQALREAEILRDQKITRARGQADKIISDARDEARRLIDSTEISVESSEEAAASEIARRAEDLAREIVSRVTNAPPPGSA